MSCENEIVRLQKLHLILYIVTFLKEGFEEDLTVLLECEDNTNLEAATVNKVISLLWKAPVLQSAALKVLTNACLQELQKQTQNTVIYIMIYFRLRFIPVIV